MTQAKIGRPRSEKSREAILRATHALLQEAGGAGLSIEAIARRAEVGKPTLYRWWPSVADIALEAVLSRAEADIAVPAFTSLRATLGLFLRRSMQAIAEGGDAHLRFLLAHAQKDEAFRERFRDNFVSKRRAVLRSIFQEARECGEIGADEDLEMFVDLIFGAMWYRLLIGHAPMDASFADALTEAVIGLGRTERAL